MSTSEITTGGATKPRLAFLGLGYMGSRMAKRLLDAGYALTVYNRDQSKTESLATAGATVASTAAEAVADVDIILSCLSNDAAVNAVILGENGVLSGAKSGTILIEMSSITPQLSRDLAVAAGGKGIPMLDAPVAGSTPQAEAGQLIVFAGGDETVFLKCQPVLAAMSKAQHYLGESGSGATMKIVNNCLLGLGLQAIAEAIALGQKAGLDRDLLLGVLAQTTVVAPAHMGKLKNAATDTYDANFPIRLMHKDLGIALGMASELRVPMPTTAVAQQLYAAELAKDKEEDFSATIDLMRELARI